MSRNDAEVATDAAAIFVELDEVGTDGVRRRVEYRARPLGVRDYIDFQAWLRKRPIREAQRVILEERITDPVAVKSIMDVAVAESSAINIILFDNDATARAFNDPDAWAHFLYYALLREHPDITLDKAYEIIDASPDAKGLVEAVQEASEPHLTEAQKKDSRAATRTMDEKTKSEAKLPDSQDSTS